MARSLDYSKRHPNANWRSDSIQFPRLISEMQAAGAFNQDQLMEVLCESMDLQPEQVMQVVERADRKWEAIKEATCRRR